MDAIVLQIFSAALAVLKIVEYSRIFPSWRIFGHVTYRVFRSITRKEKI